MRTYLTRAGEFTAKPTAFILFGLYVLAWLIVDHESLLDWHSAATVITWLMTLFIQRAEHRDTQAIHAKLDELLHATGGARNELTRLDDRDPEDVEKHRQEARARDQL